MCSIRWMNFKQRKRKHSGTIHVNIHESWHDDSSLDMEFWWDSTSLPQSCSGSFWLTVIEKKISGKQKKRSRCGNKFLSRNALENRKIISQDFYCWRRIKVASGSYDTLSSTPRRTTKIFSSKCLFIIVRRRFFFVIQLGSFILLSPFIPLSSFYGRLSCLIHTNWNASVSFIRRKDFISSFIKKS